MLFTSRGATLSPAQANILLLQTGALATNLTPSAIAIGIYFCFADAVLIIQCVYYNTLNSRKRRRARLSLEAENAVAAEEEPLLSPRRRSSSSANGGGLPGSQRRHSVRRGSSGLDPLARMVTGEDETPQRSAWLTNTLSLVAVYALGVAAWFVSREVVGADAGVPGDDGAPGEENGDAPTRMVIGLVLGYMSAVCYLTARIPQIIKNWREKSTEGMFLVLLMNLDLKKWLRD